MAYERQKNAIWFYPTWGYCHNPRQGDFMVFSGNKCKKCFGDNQNGGDAYIIEVLFHKGILLI